MIAELTEDYLVEQPAINWLKELGYDYIHGSELNPENGERESYRDVILKRRFIHTIKKINPWLDDFLAEEVYKKVVHLEHPDFVVKGKEFYKLLTNGVRLTYKEGKEERTRIVKLINFENPENNEFLVANQFTVEYEYEKEMYRRPDLVIFINGMPLAIFEFKGFNADETAKDAFNDHKIKLKDIPQLYTYAQVLVASDGLETKYGSPTSDWDRFFVWEGIFSDDDVKVEEVGEGFFRYFYQGKEMTSLEVLLKGLFRKEHFLEYLEDFILYHKEGGSYQKKIAMFHQFYAVRKAIDKTKKCVLEGKTPEERRIGVIWHTQGSGKSMTMLFYARKALKLKELEYPLLLFITDRRNLDEQLSELFSFMPISKRAESIKDLQETIKTYAGGIVFATIQKFGKGRAEEYPFLTDRRNIIVIADEAHRSQYRELAQNLRKAIPNASFMGFTATPISFEDRDTYLVFGEPISIYSMDRAKRHRVVVPIYYEARLAKLHLTNEFIDEEFEEFSEFMDEEEKEALRKKFARLETLILHPERLKAIAQDIVEHFNKRSQELEGKAMVVTISRKVAVKLYEEMVKIPGAPSVTVVISGNKHRDPEEFWPHLRNKHELEELLKRFKDPESDPKMVIVVDMLLTGFDIPCLHTMYFDKPIKDYSLAQAIARVNRVFKDKPGGLIVDYIGIADNLRKSLSQYAMTNIEDFLTDIEKVITLLKEKYDIISSLFAGIDYKNWKKMDSEALARLTAAAYNKVISEKDVFIKNYTALKKLYLLACPHPETLTIKDDIRFFEMIKKMLVKYSITKTKEMVRNLEYEINQLISKSISAEMPIDVFELMGKKKQDISILDENFLKQFKEMEFKDYAAELLAKILKDELKIRAKKNPYRYKTLYESFKKLIEKYNKKLINSVELIERLIELAEEIRKRYKESLSLNLSEEELSLFDIIKTKVKVSENFERVKEVVKEINNRLHEITKLPDWDKRDTLKAKIKLTVKELIIKTFGTQIRYEEIDEVATEILQLAQSLYKD